MEKILIIHPNKDLIEKAMELGYSVATISKFQSSPYSKIVDYFETIQYEDLNRCLEFSKKLNIDGVIAGTDASVLASNYIATELNLPGISFEVAKLIKNKFAFQKVLSQNNISKIPQSFLITTIDELDNLRHSIVFPVFVKPNDSARKFRCITC